MKRVFARAEEELISLVREGFINKKVGAQRLNMSLEEFDALLQV